MSNGNGGTAGMLASFLGTEEAPSGLGVVELPIDVAPNKPKTFQPLLYSVSGTWVGNLQEYIAIHLTPTVRTVLIATGLVLVFWLSLKKGRR